VMNRLLFIRINDFWKIIYPQTLFLTFVLLIGLWFHCVIVLVHIPFVIKVLHISLLLHTSSWLLLGNRSLLIRKLWGTLLRRCIGSLEESLLGVLVTPCELLVHLLLFTLSTLELLTSSFDTKCFIWTTSCIYFRYLLKVMFVCWCQIWTVPCEYGLKGTWSAIMVVSVRAHST
jgi:hypothetical protein